MVGGIDPRALTGVRKPTPECHEPIGRAVRQRAQHDAIDNAEDGGRRADAERYNERAQSRKARRPSKQSYPERQIAADLTHIVSSAVPGRAVNAGDEHDPREGVMRDFDLARGFYA
jgi:hypothetical protein